MKTSSFRSIGFTWDFPLISSRKLFCQCPIDLGPHWPTEEVSTLRYQPDRTASWVHNRYRFSKSPGSCAYEQGQAPPSPCPPEILAKAWKCALACGMQPFPQQFVLREYQANPRNPSGIQRSICIARGGTLPLPTQALQLDSLWLEETPAQAIFEDRGKLYDLRSFGVPRIQLRSTYCFPDLETMWDAAIAVRDLFAATGLVRPYPSATLTVRHLTHAGDEQRYTLKRDLRKITLHPEESEALEALFVDGPHKEHCQDATQETPVFQAEPYLAPLQYSRQTQRELTSQLPDTLWKWRSRWETLGLPADMREGLVRTGRAALFERIHFLNPKIPPQRWGELLYCWPTALARRGVPIHQLSEQRYLAIASLFAMGRCTRDVMPALLEDAAWSPDSSMKQLQHRMGLDAFAEELSDEVIASLIQGPHPTKSSWPARERFWMARLMRYLRGIHSGHSVRLHLHHYFSHSPPTPQDRCRSPWTSL